MLDRLLAGLMSGPNMNCRPHKSRQRVDLTLLEKLQDVSPEETLQALLGTAKTARTIANVKLPRKTKEGDPAEKAWLEQSALLTKLRVIADDARTYENDTGVHALSIGFPLLSLAPGSFAGGPRNSTKRILAPIAFIPVTVSIKGGATPSIELACRGEGADRVTPNTALLSWIEQQTGKPQNSDAFEDEEGSDPWREITELVRHVATAMLIPAPQLPLGIGQSGIAAESSAATTEAVSPPVSTHVKPAVENPSSANPVEHDQLRALPETAAQEHPLPETAPTPESSDVQSSVSDPHPPFQLKLQAAPRTDDESIHPQILLSAVLGLFPTAHQGLVRDSRAMLAEPSPQSGPIQSFLTSGVDFDAPAVAAPTVNAQPVKQRALSAQRLAAAADPCQARAVALARESAGLVVHGPPGTGKSQTITNIIADHLFRGQRVLLVCEKRTALDVVADRLEHMGLGKLCGIVHDPQRDQRDLYKSVREQLDELPEAKLHPRAEADLQKVDIELEQLHEELTCFHKSLMDPAPDGQPSFHELMGRWMSFRAELTVRLDDANVTAISVEQLETSQVALREIFERAANIAYFKNPWTRCAGIPLGEFLSRPMSTARTAMDRLETAADAADTTADDRIPAFSDNLPVQQQALERADLSARLRDAIPRPSRPG